MSPEKWTCRSPARKQTSHDEECEETNDMSTVNDVFFIISTPHEPFQKKNNIFRVLNVHLFYHEVDTKQIVKGTILLVIVNQQLKSPNR